MIHPIIDEYYVYNPYHSRSSKFAVEKGLVTNEKGATPRAVSPAATPSILTEDVKKHLPPSKTQESLFKGLTPEMHSPLAIRTMPSDNSLKSYSENSSALLDIRRVTPLATRDAARPQEQGNTKKKRISIVQVEPSVQADPEPDRVERSDTSPERTNYGDPAKIARFFPELNIS
jgi:glutamine amidotransferase